MNIRKFSLVVVAMILFSGVSIAQKYGYVNSALLLSELPEIKQADAELTTYQKQLVAKGEGMVKTLQTEFQATQGKVERGELSQIQIQQKEGELAKKQQEIQQYEQEVQQLIGQKREQLYQPILDKVKNIVDAYAKENGYNMIFDSSAGSLLFAQESDDLMGAIKAKLGL